MSDATGAPREEYALETRGVTKRFGGVTAVDDLSIYIPRQGMTAIIGPNGSGKSTLINLLSGMLPLDGGLIVVDGVGLRVIRAHEIPGLGITRTFQDVRLFDQISVWDNVMVTLTERRLLRSMLERAGARHRERARSILEAVGMWEKRDSLAEELSYGQRKLLEMGRAFAMDVHTYLFDEPFAGLFPQMLERVKTLLKRMREEGRAIIFISHNMDLVRELADHLIVLDSGRLLVEGEADEVLARPEVIEAYLGV